MRPPAICGAMKNFITPLILLAGLVLFPCGCANNGAIIVTGLRVELTAIERAADGTVSVNWRMVNPNVASYLLKEVSQKIYVNGSLVGTLFTNDPIGIPPRENALRTGKLKSDGPAAERVLAEAAARGTASYRVESKLLILIYGEETEKGDLTNTGSVPVSAK